MATSPAHHQGTELSSSPLALPLLLFPPFLSSPRPREATGGAMATERSVILLLPIPFPCPQLLVLHRTLPRKEPFQSALHRHRHLPREKVAASVLCFPWRCPTFPGTGGVPNIPRYRRNHGSRLPTFAIQPGVIGIVSARAMWMKESIHSNSLIQFDQILIMRYKERKKKKRNQEKKNTRWIWMHGEVLYWRLEKYYTPATATARQRERAAKAWFTSTASPAAAATRTPRRTPVGTAACRRRPDGARRCRGSRPESVPRGSRSPGRAGAAAGRSRGAPPWAATAWWEWGGRRTTGACTPWREATATRGSSGAARTARLARPRTSAEGAAYVLLLLEELWSRTAVTGVTGSACRAVASGRMACWSLRVASGRVAWWVTHGKVASGLTTAWWWVSLEVVACGGRTGWWCSTAARGKTGWWIPWVASGTREWWRSTAAACSLCRYLWEATTPAWAAACRCRGRRGRLPASGRRPGPGIAPCCSRTGAPRRPRTAPAGAAQARRGCSSRRRRRWPWRRAGAR
uniref:Uncharacterized protein n=1 Tax=Zea mays TaxID=4577 RepID=A0A804PEK9_MAIZE